ncbi:MAG: glutathione transferase GstA, partial [Rubrivivax sp.]
PGACSLSPHIALHETGLAHELVRAPTKTHKLDDGTDYYTINPLGYVPLLELEDGTRVTEGPAIVQYLADLVPHKKLAPPNGTIERTQLQSWLNFISTEVHKGFGPLFSPATPEDYKSAVKERLHGRLKWVDAQLEGKTWLTGDDFTVADGYLFVVTNWAGPMDLDLAPYANLRGWRDRVAARPAVQAAMKMEGLLK